MEKTTCLQFRINFSQEILEQESSEFSEFLRTELLSVNILLFDQWGPSFCEGFIDVKDYRGKIAPESFLYAFLEKTNAFKFVSSFRVVLEDNGLEYKISKIDDQSVEIEVSSTKQGGLTIYHDLSEAEKAQYFSNGIEFLKERINDMNENIGKYKVVSWR